VVAVEAGGDENPADQEEDGNGERAGIGERQEAQDRLLLAGGIGGESKGMAVDHRNGGKEANEIEVVALRPGDVGGKDAGRCREGGYAAGSRVPFGKRLGKRRVRRHRLLPPRRTYSLRSGEVAGDRPAGALVPHEPEPAGKGNVEILCF